MKLLVTGVCGFAGSVIALDLLQRIEGLEVHGMDNLSRPGSELNRQRLKRAGIHVHHGDIRLASDFDSLPAVDWVIDAAANPSVLAGVAGVASSRQLMEHNLVGTLQVLEYCKRHGSGLVMLSTSRVYSVTQLSSLSLEVTGNRLSPAKIAMSQPGLSDEGISEDFSTESPLSLYGAAKRASEVIILDYSTAFDFPAHVNRCGMLAGAGQFGKPDQGIFSYWLHSYRWNRPLKYIGFGGAGHQVRDCLHPRDLAALIAKQITSGRGGSVRNVSGGRSSAISLAELSEWCAARWGEREVMAAEDTRPYDVPWLVLDSSRAMSEWSWEPEIRLPDVLEEIVLHAEANPEWLELSGER